MTGMPDTGPFTGVTGVQAIPFSGAAGVTQVLTSLRAGYAGHSVKESTGAAAAELDIYSGNSAAGIPLAKITLAANESARDYIPFPYVDAPGGIFVSVASGSVDASIYVAIEQ